MFWDFIYFKISLLFGRLFPSWYPQKPTQTIRPWKFYEQSLPIISKRVLWSGLIWFQQRRHLANFFISFKIKPGVTSIGFTTKNRIFTPFWYQNCKNCKVVLPIRIWIWLKYSWNLLMWDSPFVFLTALHLFPKALRIFTWISRDLDMKSV